MPIKGARSPGVRSTSIRGEDSGSATHQLGDPGGSPPFPRPHSGTGVNTASTSPEGCAASLIEGRSLSSTPSEPWCPTRAENRTAGPALLDCFRLSPLTHSLTHACPLRRGAPGPGQPPLPGSPREEQASLMGIYSGATDVYPDNYNVRKGGVCTCKGPGAGGSRDLPDSTGRVSARGHRRPHHVTSCRPC